jgi:homoserine dehydrogenase
VLITYATRETEIRKALDLIGKDGHIASSPKLIRIEEL